MKDNFTNTIFIYTLSFNNDIRYIGITNNIDKRFKQHLNESNNKKNIKKYNSHKSNWIRKVKDIKISVIDICDKSDFGFWEKHYISLFRSWGFNLLNKTMGGEGIYGYKFSNDVKYKKSKNMIGDKNHFFGKKHKDETKLILSKVNRSGCKNSMYGKKHTKETIKILSEKKIGIYEGGKNPRARKLYQYDLQNNLLKCWDCAKYCADFYNISRGNISTYAKNNTNVDLYENGVYKILNGFIFKYK